MILIGLLLILIGAAWYYFQAYKNNQYIEYATSGFIFIGWIIMLFTLFGKRLMSECKLKFRKHKWIWIKDKFTKAAIYLLFTVSLISNIELVHELGNKRINFILNHKPTQTAIATVTKIESRNTRGGSKFWAVIQYSAKEKAVKQFIYDPINIYKVGQNIEIVYSIEYPEMFYVLR